MNTLVVNLTRFGDLLQSAAALRALARGPRGEKNRIGLVCLENFVAGAELLPNVDSIYPLPAGKIMAALNTRAELSEKRDAAWLAGVAGFHGWLKTVTEDFAPGAVCNMSPTIAACLLGRLLAGETTTSGFALDAYGFMHNTTPWASFLQGATAARTNSPFNIVDIFRKIAGDLGDAPDASLLPPPEEAVAGMRALLANAVPQDAAGFAALQLGASADIRRWPVRFFAETGDALWENHRLVPLLLGTADEIPLAEEYAAIAQNPHHSLAGQTNITDLAAALSLSALCVSNDTGTLHLASGLGVPVIGIYLATAQAWDTGPYAPGNCALEPDMACHPCGFGTRCENSHACREAILPATLISLAGAKIRSGSWNAAGNGAPGIARGARVWESARDAYGFADLVSLSGHDGEGRTRWLRIQRHLYRQFFDRDPAAPFVPGSVNAPPPLDSENAPVLAASCDALLPLLDALEQQAAMLAHNPIPLVADRFQRTWRRLAGMLAALPDFSALAYLWQTETMAASSLENALPVVRHYHALFRAIRSFLP